MKYLIFLLLEDFIISFGLYYLCEKSHLRKCQKQGTMPKLRSLRIDFMLGWLLVHGFIIGAFSLLVEWGGQN